MSTHTKSQGFNSLLFSHKRLLGFKVYKLNEKNSRNTLLMASFSPATPVLKEVRFFKYENTREGGQQALALKE